MSCEIPRSFPDEIRPEEALLLGSDNRFLVSLRLHLFSESKASGIYYGAYNLQAEIRTEEKPLLVIPFQINKGAVGAEATMSRQNQEYLKHYSLSIDDLYKIIKEKIYNKPAFKVELNASNKNLLVSVNKGYEGLTPGCLDQYKCSQNLAAACWLERRLSNAMPEGGTVQFRSVWQFD